MISAILGVAERTTMDMDTTVKVLPMDEQSIRKAISEILDQTVNDEIEFQLLDLTPIREDDEYENFRASIQATYGKMKIPMKIDITAGDEITPKDKTVLLVSHRKSTMNVTVGYCGVSDKQLPGGKERINLPV